MFDLQIDKKNIVFNEQNMLHVDVLYTIKRKKYKTVCAELAFTKSPSTEFFFFICLTVGSFFYIDKTGSTETQFLRPNR
jgi:hypothetical protein